MKSLYHISASHAIIAVLIIVALSCTKSSNNPSTTRYCNETDWSNTFGASGTFTGAFLNGRFNLVEAILNDNGNNTNIPFHYDASDHLISDQQGISYVYSQNVLVNMIIAFPFLSGTLTFDSKGHLTAASLTSSDNSSTVQEEITYTYDSNEDPVNISIHGTITNADGTSTADAEITGDYLTDKGNFLPFVPTVAPFSGLFAYTIFTSRHLINKWDIKTTLTVNGVATPDNFTRQYTYTYDNNGRVATMVHSGNSNNIFTFTYSGCN